MTELENDNIVSRRQEPLCQMASKQDDPPEGWGRYSTFRTIKLQKTDYEPGMKRKKNNNNKNNKVWLARRYVQLKIQVIRYKGKKKLKK